MRTASIVLKKQRGLAVIECDYEEAHAAGVVTSAAGILAGFCWALLHGEAHAAENTQGCIQKRKIKSNGDLQYVA